MQAQSIAYVPTWMRFYERAQALGAFGVLTTPHPAPPVLEPQGLAALKNLFDFTGIAASQPHVAADA